MNWNWPYCDFFIFSSIHLFTYLCISIIELLMLREKRFSLCFRFFSSFNIPKSQCPIAVSDDPKFWVLWELKGWNNVSNCHAEFQSGLTSFIPWLLDPYRGSSSHFFCSFLSYFFWVKCQGFFRLKLLCMPIMIKDSNWFWKISLKNLTGPHIIWNLYYCS